MLHPSNCQSVHFSLSVHACRGSDTPITYWREPTPAAAVRDNNDSGFLLAAIIQHLEKGYKKEKKKMEVFFLAALRRSVRLDEKRVGNVPVSHNLL
jgi:hypothetical protein